MTIRIGDKVRFLNEVGGGVVSGFKSKQVVLVEDEDGFEIPVLISECVVIKASSGPGMTTAPVNEISAPAPQDTNTVQLHNKRTFQAYVAISPEHPDAPLQGKVELYLINDSNYFVYYLCEENSNNGKSFGDGLLHPNTHQPLGTFSAQELGEIGKMKIRLLPFMRGNAYNQLATKNKTIAFNAVKLSKSKSYVENEHLSFKAYLMPLHKDEVEEAIKELKPDSIGSQLKHQSEQSRLRSPKQDTDLIEVDLHIDSLVDDLRSMSKADMLEFQLKTFEDTIKEYKNKKGQRIVFIHGVGNGRLKTDIRKALERKHKLDFQDASFREYGYGATMVIIH